MKKPLLFVLAAMLSLLLIGCVTSTSMEFTFEASDVKYIEMFHFIVPAEAKKKVITNLEDIADLYDTLEGITLKAKQTELVAGGSVTSFRFHLSDSTDFEVIYTSIAVKPGRIKTTGSETDFFTSADIQASWNKYNCDTVGADESELPVFS